MSIPKCRFGGIALATFLFNACNLDSDSPQKRPAGPQAEEQSTEVPQAPEATSTNDQQNPAGVVQPSADDNSAGGTNPAAALCAEIPNSMLKGDECLMPQWDLHDFLDSKDRLPESSTASTDTAAPSGSTPAAVTCANLGGRSYAVKPDDVSSTYNCAIEQWSLYRHVNPSP